MTDQDVQLSQREATQSQEESNLHAELVRIMAGSMEYEKRVKHLKAALAEAEGQGAHDGHVAERVRSMSVPALDAETPFAPVREQRQRALEARELATQEVRKRITTFRAQIQQLSQALGADEKAVQRLAQQAKQQAAEKLEKVEKEPVDDAALGATLISAVPPKALRQRAQTQPPQPAAVVHATAPTGKPVPKRQSPRVRMQAQVDFESDDNFFNGFSANISDGGLFVATVNVLPLGTAVDVGFSLPTGERIECKGVVRWVREIDDKNPDIFPGMGVQFVDLEARSAQAIETFIQQREPMFYVE